MKRWVERRQEPHGSHPLSKELYVLNYASPQKERWDAFIETASNATFLFKRDYMDYHQHRFEDHSLLVCSGEKIVAVLPGNSRSDGWVASHDGLTYGGLVVSASTTLRQVLAYWDVVLRHLVSEGVTTMWYKRLPTFYATRPDDDVAYGLSLLGAALWRRDCAQVLLCQHRCASRNGAGARSRRPARAGCAWFRRLVSNRFGSKCWLRALPLGTELSRCIPRGRCHTWLNAFPSTSSSSRSITDGIHASTSKPFMPGSLRSSRISCGNQRTAPTPAGTVEPHHPISLPEPDLGWLPSRTPEAPEECRQPDPLPAG